jgi:integrase
MRVYLRGKVYWFELVFNGQRYQRSTQSKNQRVAGQIASTFHSALAKGDVGITERRDAPAFDKAMEAFLGWSIHEHHDHPNTTKRYQVSSRPLLRRFRKTPLDKITAEDVENYKELRSTEKSKRTERKLRPATVNRELACMRAMFNYAIKGHPDLRNPVARVKFLAENNQQERVLTFTEQRAYLKCATPVLADVAGLMLETGMRPEEVYTLKVDSVDLDRGYLRVLRGKTPAAKRRIELSAECRRILEGRIENAPASGFLFPHDTDETKPIPKVHNAHTRAVKESKVEKFKPYDLRHTWATRAAESGIDLVTLAAMMGHSRIQMVMRYAHPTQIHQSSAMHRLSEFNQAKEAKEEALRAKQEAARREGKPTVLSIRSAS